MKAKAIFKEGDTVARKIRPKQYGKILSVDKDTATIEWSGQSGTRPNKPIVLPCKLKRLIKIKL